MYRELREERCCCESVSRSLAIMRHMGRAADDMSIVRQTRLTAWQFLLNRILALRANTKTTWSASDHVMVSVWRHHVRSATYNAAENRVVIASRRRRAPPKNLIFRQSRRFSRAIIEDRRVARRPPPRLGSNEHTTTEYSESAVWEWAQKLEENKIEK